MIWSFMGLLPFALVLYYLPYSARNKKLPRCSLQTMLRCLYIMVKDINSSMALQNFSKVKQLQTLNIFLRADLVIRIKLIHVKHQRILAQNSSRKKCQLMCQNHMIGGNLIHNVSSQLWILVPIKIAPQLMHLQHLAQFKIEFVWVATRQFDCLLRN